MRQIATMKTNINPGETEVCDGADIDENCNSLADDDDATVSSGSSLRIIMTKMAMAMVERLRRRVATRRLAMLLWATVMRKTQVSILRPRGSRCDGTISAREQ